MNDADEHDGEREVKDKDRLRSRSFAGKSPDPTAKLVPIEGSGLSGPFIRRPVMTVLLTLSVIVAGLAERAGAACYNSAVAVGPSDSPMREARAGGESGHWILGRRAPGPGTSPARKKRPPAGALQLRALCSDHPVDSPAFNQIAL